MARWVRLAVVAGIVLAVIIGFDWVPFLRGGDLFRWLWAHQPVPSGAIVGMALALMLFAGVGWWLARSQRTRWCIAWAMLGAAVLPIIVVGLRYEQPMVELLHRTLSPVTTGPHFAAARIDWSGTAWHHWTQVMHDMRETSIHVALSPPGLPLLHAGLNTLLNLAPGLSEALERALLPHQCHNFTVLSYDAPEVASALFGVLMPLWAALAVLPLYAVGRRLLRADVARWLVLFWPLVPAYLLFAPTWNTLYPMLALLCFWLLLRGLDAANGALWQVDAGLLCGLLTFMNFSLVPLAGLFGFYTLFYGLRQPDWRRGFQRAVYVGIWFGLGALLPWLIFMLLTGETPLAMLSTAFDAHLDLDRPYLPWLWMHGWEWVLLSSVPFAVLWLAQARRDLLAGALLATLLVLLFSHTARGETGRVWLFFTPFLLLAGASALQQISDQQRLAAWGGLLLAQAALTLALVTTWDVISAPDIQAPPDPPIAQGQQPQNALFGDVFRLVGWSGVREGDELVLHLNWQAQRQMTTPYYFAVVPVAPTGQPTEAFVWQPDATRYPTTCWPAGVTIGDTVRIPLPEAAPAGDWWLSLRAFADVQHPLATLPVHLPDGSTETQLGLGPVR